MSFGFPFQLVIVAASYFLEGISRPRRVMVVNLGVLPFNALLAWVLADGLLGFPKMGAVGAATATVLASALGAVALLVAVWTLAHADAGGVHSLGMAGVAGVGRGIGRGEGGGRGG